MKRKIKIMGEALGKKFSDRKTSHSNREPVDNLILTILSQNTSDSLRDRAYISLRNRFPSNDEVARADLSEIKEAITIGGLSKQKSETIKRTLTAIQKDHGEITLSFLADKSTDESISYLKNIKGIGDKTAAIVMLFSFNRKTFPVDTHIQRIIKRMGLVPANYSPEKIRNSIEPYIPDGRAMNLHVHLIALGKTICRANHPDCHICPLETMCAFGRNRMAGKT